MAGGHDTASPIDASSADQIRVVRAVEGGCVWETPAAGFKMNGNRWYPTCLTMANGDSLIVGGSSPFALDDFAGLNDDYEYFDWSQSRLYTRDDTARDFPRDAKVEVAGDPRRREGDGTRLAGLYPLMHLLPNGPDSDSPAFVLTESFARIYDPAGNRILGNKIDVGGFRTWPTQASSVLLPIDVDSDGNPPDQVEILVFGGGTTGQANSTDPAVQRADLYTYTVSDHSLRSTQSIDLNRRRFMGDSILLPDGNLALVGGAEAGYASRNHPRATMIELIQPRTFQDTDMANAGIPRGYHATSLLLPDGSVYIAGGTGGWPGLSLGEGHIGEPGGVQEEYFDVQVWQPPYFGGGTRPTITAAPATVRHGVPFEVRTPSATVRDLIVLTRHGSRTHSLDTDQRMLRLAARRREEGGAVVLSARLPDDPGWAPPGPYLLWLLRGCGEAMGGGHVPSKGWSISVTG